MSSRALPERKGKTYGEDLFEQYLLDHDLPFEYEPSLGDRTRRLVDYVIPHEQGPVYLEVKAIEHRASSGGVFDPYGPIRSEIREGMKKFRALKGDRNALVLAAAPRSFVMLSEPQIILGAMYGDEGFRLPFDPTTGRFEDAKLVREFIVGKGLMVRSRRSAAPALMNTRLSAIITLHNESIFSNEVNAYLDAEDGRPRAERMADVSGGKVTFSQQRTQFVTVYENAAAVQPLPPDLFRCDMDAWWTAGGGSQELTYLGEKRMRLKVHVPS